MDLKVTHIRSIDVGGYKHRYEDLCKNFTYPMSINKERTITTQGALTSREEIIYFLLFFLLKSIEEEIQPSDNNVDAA